MSRIVPSPLTDSVDIQGVSIVTANRSSSDGRFGMAYHPVHLAAAVPVYFQPTNVANVLVGVFSRRYTDGTVSTTDPAAYSAWTQDDAPSWALINTVTGSSLPINGSFTVPMSTPCDSRVVEGATGFAPGYFYLLNTATTDDVDSVVIQHFFLNDSGVMMLAGEETMATITADAQTVLFNRGVYFDYPHVIVVGSGADDDGIYLARKQLGWIGSNREGWRYQSEKGWSTDASEITALTKVDGSPLTTVGRCSAVIYKKRTFLSVVEADGSDRNGVVYTSKGMQWKQMATVALGAAGSSYLGGLNLQQQLGGNPTSEALVDQSNVAGYPFVVSQLSTGGGLSTINTQWDVLGIPRLS